MTALDLQSVLARTKTKLEELQRDYVSLGRAAPDEARSAFAEFLAGREADTIVTLEQYLDSDEHRAALDVHVRLGGGFPFEAVRDPHRGLPELDELIARAEASDGELAQLAERIRMYSAAEQLGELLESLDDLVKERRERLAAATRELETIAPSEAVARS